MEEEDYIYQIHRVEVGVYEAKWLEDESDMSYITLI